MMDRLLGEVILLTFLSSSLGGVGAAGAVDGFVDELGKLLVSV